MSYLSILIFIWLRVARGGSNDPRKQRLVAQRVATTVTVAEFSST